MVDVDVIRQKSVEYPVQYREKAFHIVTVCRLAPEKRLKNIIYCCKRLKRVHDVCWHIVGTGTQYEELSQLIVAEHLEDTIVLEGGQENPYPFMKSADLYVHTSYFESQGLTILESMALGIPCVAVRSQGPCEYIQDGVNGILAERGVGDLYDKVRCMIQDQTLYQRIKANTQCPDMFYPQSIMSKISEIL